MGTKGYAAFAGIESLEPRQLLSASYPTANEQYLLELINRARANPTAEATRYGIDLNEGLTAGTISTAAKQPLAFNTFLVNAARGHSQDMIDHDYFEHQGSDGSQPADRMAASGYFFDPAKTRGSGENIGWSGSYPSVPNQTSTTAQIEKDLFIDAGIPGRGHRTNILNPSYKEIGTGVVSGAFTDAGQTYNAVMVTQDFAYVLPSAFLTGVAYTDAVDHNKFYTPGEGIGGLTVTARRTSDNAVFSTKTFSSGGYTLPLAAGTYTVTASGTGLSSPITFSNVSISSLNVKRDLVPGTVSTPTNTPPAARLTASSVTAGGGRTYTFKVTYTDPDKVKASTIGSTDIRVTGPHSFVQKAQLVSKTPTTDAKSIVAVYRITTPGGRWDKADNGTYAISLLGKQVSDIRGLFAAAGRIGVFSVKIS